jgi:hypothetical protein
MIDRRDPEFPALHQDATWRLDKEFLAGTIGESTYLRSLLLLGVKPDDAAQALRELNSTIRVSYEERRLQASLQWMETYRAR